MRRKSWALLPGLTSINLPTSSYVVHFKCALNFGEAQLLAVNKAERLSLDMDGSEIARVTILSNSF
jgi:hypothetical protein